MSKQVDERVVSMQFDNKHFEANVQTSLSTIDKLKQKLNFKDASKGLENINAASKNVNMNGLGNAVEAVHAKFSALEVMGVTALANITNSAVNAGKKIVSALTIDPIKTGFKEYETQINAVQTILANTQSKGTTIDDVNKALEELNLYADKTIYNFTEMTRNIGTFTAAGVDLDTSVNAIQGIANLAAVSGSTSQQASTAMYQLSQALASGTVKLMDWNSVVNAGMGGQVFQDALKETARVHGVAIDKMIENEGSFRDTLSKGWLTSEILTETLQKFTLTTEGLTEEQIKANREMLKAKGYTEAQIDEIFKLGTMATNAATKVKTFTQLWDVLKESAQSGWAQTWKLIVGDFEEAKGLLSPLADVLTGIINGISNARNKLLEGAMSSPFGKLAEKINTVSGATDKMKEATDKAANGYKDLDDVVQRVIRGDFENAPVRFQKLAEAGYNWAEVQNKVNEELGYSFRYSTDLGEVDKKLNNTQKDLNETQAATVEQMLKMSDAQLLNIGFTKEEVEAFRDLEIQCKKAGISVSDFLKDTSLLDGRTLLINSFKNAGQGLVAIFRALKEAWVEIFPPMTSEQLYNIIAAIHNFSLNLRVGEKTAKNLKDTFKGLFAILDIVLKIVGGPIKIAFKILGQLLGAFDMDIWSVTGAIGRAIVRFNDWLDSALDFTGVFKKLVPYVKAAIDAIRNFGSAIKKSKFYQAGVDIVDGLKNGIKSGAKNVIDTIIDLGERLLDSIKNVLGIHSPSTKFIEVGKNIILGLVKGLQNGASFVWNVIKTIGSKCIDLISQIDIGTIFAAALTAGVFYAFKRITDIIKAVVMPFDALSGLFENLSNGIKSWFKAAALEKKSKALLNIAKAIGILAVSLAILTLIDQEKLWGAIVAITALSLIMVALLAVAKLMNKAGTITIQTMPILAIAAAITLLASAMKKLSKVDDMEKAIAGFATIIVGFIALMLAMRILVSGKYDSAKAIAKAGTMMLALSIAFSIMANVMKKLSKLDDKAIEKGIAVIGSITVMFSLLMVISKLTGDNATKAGGMMLLMAGALLIMITVVKRISKLDEGAINKGIGVISGIMLMFTFVMAFSKLAGENATKAGAMMILMAGALLIMVTVIRNIEKLNEQTIKKGIVVVGALTILFTMVMAFSKLAGNNAVKAGAMMILMAGALLIVTGVLFILSRMNADGLERATKVVLALGILFGGLIAVTNLVKDSSKTLTTLVIAIAILVAAVVGLTLVDSTKLFKAVGAISAIMLVFGALIALTKFTKNTKGMRQTLWTMIGIIGILTALIAALTFLDPSKLMTSTKAITIVITAFTAAMLILTKAGKMSKTVSKMLVPMMLVITGLAAILVALSIMKTSNSVQNATALGVLMNAFAASMIVFSKVGTISKNTMKNMAPILGVVAGLAVILGIMGALNAEASVQSAIALGILLNAMASAMVILGYVGKTSLNAIGTMAVLGLVVGELAIILGLMSTFDVEPSIATATALSILLTAMSRSLVILAAVGATGPAAFVGIGALATLIAGIGGLVVAMGAIMDKFPIMEQFLDKGIVVLEKIGLALGSLIGGIVGGIAKGLFAGLPGIGTYLSDFMTNAKPFIDGAKSIDAKMMEGVKSLAQVILILTAADIVQAIASALTGDSSLSEFGRELVPFGKSMKEYAKEIDGIDAGVVTASANAAKALAEMAKNVPKRGGLAAAFAGENNIANFGDELISFGKSIKAYAKEVDGLDGDVVTASANAAKALAEMANNVPKRGGLAAVFAGENNIANFGDELVSFGKSIKAYAAEVDGLDGDVVTASANAAKSIAEMANNIPNEGGLVALFAGDNSLANFSPQLKPLGTGLKDFANEVSGIKPAVITAAANAAKSIAEMAKNIPNQGGLVALLAGDNSLAKFSPQLKPLGIGLKDFANAVSGVNPVCVVAAANAGKALAEMANSLPNIGGLVSLFEGEIDIASFGEDLVPLGEGLRSFSNSVTGCDTAAASAAADVAKSLADVANNLPDKNLLEKLYELVTGDNEMNKFASALGGLGKGIGEFSRNAGDVDAAKCTAAGNALVTISRAIENLDETGGWDGFWNGDKDLSQLGDALPSLGQKLKEFSDKISGVDADKLNAAASLVAVSLNIANSLLDTSLGESYVQNFGTYLGNIGQGLKDYVNATQDIKLDTIKPSMDALIALLDLVTGTNKRIDGDEVNIAGAALMNLAKGVERIGEVDIGGLLEKITNISEAFKDYVDVSGFSNTLSEEIKGFEKTGEQICMYMAKGMAKELPNLITTLEHVCYEMLNAIGKKVKLFKQSGKDLATGLINGIKAKEDDVYNAAFALGQKAVQGEKDGQKSESPSKLTYQSGLWFGEGLVNGINYMSDAVYTAGRNLGTTATSSLSNSIARMASIIDGDMDVQPTIRPVLDLSDVTSGVGFINGLFGMNPSMGVLANVNGISSMMNRGQNGSNDDVISAIEKLGKSIDESAGDNYYFGDIRTGDDDALSSAVETIIRAAKVERRA